MSQATLRQEDRREWVRYPTHLEAFYHPGPDQPGDFWRLAEVRDLSVGGIGLLVNRCLDAGTVLTVELDTANGNPSQVHQARVVHAKPQADGTWFLGCIFVNKLRAADLQACGVVL